MWTDFESGLKISVMERCLLMIVIHMKTWDVILRTIFLVTLSSVVTLCSVMMTNLLDLEDPEESFADVNWSIVSEEERSDSTPIDVLEQCIDPCDTLSFSSDSIFDDTLLFQTDTTWDTVSNVAPLITPSLISSTSTSSSVKRLAVLCLLSLPREMVDEDKTTSFPLSSDGEAPGTSCGTVANVQYDKKNKQIETTGTCNSALILTDHSSTINSNEMDIEESELGSSTEIFSHTAFVAGSKLVSFITRQHLREKISARSPLFSGETSSGNTQKKPDEVDTERREKKKKLNRDWARKDRAKRQKREKELKGVISRLGHENKKLEMELRILREDLVIFKRMWLLHRVFYHE